MTPAWVQIQICYCLFSILLTFSQKDLHFRFAWHCDAAWFKFLSVLDDLRWLVVWVQEVLQCFTVELYATHCDRGIRSEDTVYLVLLQGFENEVNGARNDALVLFTLKVTAHRVGLARTCLAIRENTDFLSIDDWPHHILHILKNISLYLFWTKYLVKLEALWIDSGRAELLRQTRDLSWHRSIRVIEVESQLALSVNRNAWLQVFQLIHRHSLLAFFLFVYLL